MLEPDTIVQVLLRERLRVTALAAAVIRDVHAADDIFQQVVLAASRRGRISGTPITCWRGRSGPRGTGHSIWPEVVASVRCRMKFWTCSNRGGPIRPR